MDTYKTKDLYLAAYLYAKNANFLMVEKTERIGFFVFDELILCSGFEREYYGKTGQVIAKDYAEAIRTLKDLLFSK